MTEVTLEFVDDFPDLFEAAIRELISPMLRLVRRNLANIYFHMSHDTEAAEISVMRRYHSAHVYFAYGFFSEDVATKRKVLVHELVHVLVDTLQKHGAQMIDAYFEEGSPEHALLRVRFEESSEELTDALALAFLDILDELESTLEFPIDWEAGANAD